MNSRGNAIARARAIYDGRLNPQSTQQMRGHLEASAAESSALIATSALCDYLNRWNDAGSDEVAKAEAAVHHAIGTKPDHYLGHYAKGFLHRTKGEHEAALAAFTETVKHNPDFARGHAQLGAELVYLGRPEEGIAQVEKAIKLSPQSKSLGMFQWIIGRARFFMGQYAEAVPWLQQSARAWPHLWYNRLYLASAYAHLGNKAAATRTLRAFEKRFPGWTLARVAEEEKSNPNNNHFMVTGRQHFHAGLRRAGMTAG
ncbi:MAG TPA: tetratricopeptide repeat protein [Stellaceae bacterium]|jgi:tetratricopeptide (TPR) repeat protein|nr:tetratricopeptide repeat protein [Stellaceae bacterium]